MGEQITGISPAVLRWARESQGYSVDDVALQMKRAPGDISAWETGAQAPTYSQLEKLAYQLYKRPLAVFFLPEPPAEPKLKQEFRTLPDFELDQLSAHTRYQLRLAHAFQISIRELNDGVNPARRQIFRDLGLDATADIRVAADALREYLEIPLTTQSSWKSADEALKHWRNAVEQAGVFVFKQAFKQKAISGFCLADDEFPLIYLNNSSAKTRQSFTLFHELAHLLLNVNAISKFDDDYVAQLPAKERRIERFCNALAAEFLVPENDFSAQLKRVGSTGDEAVGELARRYHVSRAAVLRRMLDRGLVDRAYYS